jgi:hypothetical protein
MQHSKKYVCSLLAIQHKNLLFTSNGVKTQSSHESKAKSQRLCVWWAFDLYFFLGKIFETTSIVLEKGSKEKSWRVKPTI